MRTRSDEPTLKISPEISRASISPTTARTVSDDVTEGARLRAVAVHLERRTGEGALDEARDDHSVLARLLRADRVEEADDHAVEAPLLVEAEREELVHRLRVRVQPAALA